MDYEEWVMTVTGEIKADSLWKMTAYRLALFLGDLGWRDMAKLMRDRRMIRLSDQLYQGCSVLHNPGIIQDIVQVHTIVE